jgi:hypothetical protein
LRASSPLALRPRGTLECLMELREGERAIEFHAR